MKQETPRCIFQNELDKACFQHDMAYGNFKDLNRRTFADKVSRDKGFNIAKDTKYDLIKIRQTQHKSTIRSFNKRKV